MTMQTTKRIIKAGGFSDMLPYIKKDSAAPLSAEPLCQTPSQLAAFCGCSFEPLAHSAYALSDIEIEDCIARARRMTKRGGYACLMISSEGQNSALLFVGGFNTPIRFIAISPEDDHVLAAYKWSDLEEFIPLIYGIWVQVSPAQNEPTMYQINHFEAVLAELNKPNWAPES